MSLTDYGLEIPSPFASLQLENSEISSMTTWSLNVVVGGDYHKKSNIAAFEGLLYSAAQAADGYENSAGVPVSFAFGWLNEDGSVGEYLSYQGFTLQFNVSTSGQYMQYTVKGYASLAVQSSMPVLHIPELSGVVQPSAVVEALALAVKADAYYELDIDHNDAPTLISHGPLTTSFNRYVRGNLSAEDNYDDFPGLLKLSKSYSGSRDAAGLASGYKSLSQVLNNATVSPVDDFLKMSLTDNTVQCASFSYWVDEPTMTSPGVIHYKSNAGLALGNVGDVLQYGTSDTNILSISGQYNGVAYNMTDMNFASIGFAVDGSGNTIVEDAQVVNSWSASLADVFQTANIVNDINAIASQFSGSFQVQIPGSVKTYSIAQPVSLIVAAGNTLSPISGIYNVISVSHSISQTFVTSLTLQRLVVSSANAVAASQGIYITGSSSYPKNAYNTTSNVKSSSYIDFGVLYPDFTHLTNYSTYV